MPQKWSGTILAGVKWFNADRAPERVSGAELSIKTKINIEEA